MLNASNREFRNKFGHLAGFWRGKNPLQRNAIIGLAHFKDKTAIDELIEVLNTDVRPAIRGTAAWRSEEHTSELQSRGHLVCRLLLEKKKKKKTQNPNTTRE